MTKIKRINITVSILLCAIFILNCGKPAQVKKQDAPHPLAEHLVLEMIGYEDLADTTDRKDNMTSDTLVHYQIKTENLEDAQYSFSNFQKAEKELYQPIGFNGINIYYRYVPELSGLQRLVFEIKIGSLESKETKQIIYEGWPVIKSYEKGKIQISLYQNLFTHSKAGSSTKKIYNDVSFILRSKNFGANEILENSLSGNKRMTSAPHEENSETEEFDFEIEYSYRSNWLNSSVDVYDFLVIDYVRRAKSNFRVIFDGGEKEINILNGSVALILKRSAPMR